MMQTAISIPDNIFNQAEKLAQTLGISRSELYTQAITAYLKDTQSYQITDQLNQVYAHQNSNLPDEISQMQFSSLTVEQW
ncbi:MAG: hypothetical protein AB4058_17840 [Microcystaceae cyanobacterium]